MVYNNKPAGVHHHKHKDPYYSRLFSNGSLKSTRFNSNAILATGFKLPVKKKSGCPSNFIYLPEATDIRPAANAVFMYLYLKT